MTDKELKKLSRIQLMELLLDMTKKLDETTAALEQERETTQRLKQQLEDKTVKINKVGSLAEASLQLAGVYQAADEAAAIYLENIKRLDAKVTEMEKKVNAKVSEYEEQCKRILAEAEEKTRAEGMTDTEE